MLYIRQLKKFVLLYNKHKARFNKIKLENLLHLDCSVLPHPPYSRNMALSDFHVFPPLQNTIND